MPANLTPEYEKAELRYRQATSDEERLAALQAMLSSIPKHKGTSEDSASFVRLSTHLPCGRCSPRIARRSSAS